MSIKLDIKDRKILYELELNARIHELELAKKVRLSREVIRYRLEKLQERGIIRSYNTIVNSMNLGYLMYRTYFKFINLNKEKETEIIHYLTEKVNWITKVEGKWNLSTMIFTKSVYDYEQFINEFHRIYGNYIQNYQVSTMTKLWHYKRGYLLDRKESGNILLTANSKEISQIDDTDKKILTNIISDARIKYVDLAKKLGINEKLIRDRIKKMIDKKIILGFTTFLDLNKLEKLYFKVNFNLKNCAEVDFKRLLSYAENHPDIIYVIEAVGGDDFEIEVQVDNNNQLYKIIEEIRQTFSEIIFDYYFMEYTKEYKFDYLPRI